MRTAALFALVMSMLAAATIAAQSTPSAWSTGARTEQPAQEGRVTVPEPTPEALSYYRSGNVLWKFDNALNRRQLLVVMGHEMGHYVLRYAWKLILILSALIVAALYAAATAFVTLQQENLGVPRPGPIFTWWRASHPPLGERIDFSNDYRPWEKNEPLVYADRFKQP